MEIIVTSVIGVICTALSSLVTWLFTRRKYNTEVEHNNIENMEGSLEFYERLSASNNKILAEVLKKSEELAKSNVELLIEVQNLRAQIGILTEILKSEVNNLDFEKYGIKINDDGTLTRA